MIHYNIIDLSTQTVTITLFMAYMTGQAITPMPYIKKLEIKSEWPIIKFRYRKPHDCSTLNNRPNTRLELASWVYYFI